MTDVDELLEHDREEAARAEIDEWDKAYEAATGRLPSFSRLFIEAEFRRRSQPLGADYEIREYIVHPPTQLDLEHRPGQVIVVSDVERYKSLQRMKTRPEW